VRNIQFDVALRIDGDADEADTLRHVAGRDVLLDAGHGLALRRTGVGAARVDEIEDHDLAEEIGGADGAAVGVGQAEGRKRRADAGLEGDVGFPAHQIGLDLVERVGPCRNANEAQRDKCDERSHARL
jgi:hypothetical protein